MSLNLVKNGFIVNEFEFKYISGLKCMNWFLTKSGQSPQGLFFMVSKDYYYEKQYWMSIFLKGLKWIFTLNIVSELYPLYNYSVQVIRISKIKTVKTKMVEQTL